MHLNPGEKNKKFFKGIQRELQSPTLLQDDSPRDNEEAKSGLWTTTEEFLYRHLVERRVKLYVPKKKQFLSDEVHPRYQNDSHIT